MEFLRRLLFVSGLLGGVWAWFDGPPVLISVGVEDFARDKEQAESEVTGFLERDKTLEEFYRQRTEGRLVRVEGPKWTALWAAVRAATGGGEENGELRARRGRDFYADRLYFLPDEAPIAEAAGSLEEGRPLVYLTIGAEGPAAPTLVLDRVESGDAAGKAPVSLLHPHRNLALWLVLAGLLGYLFWPRRTRPAGAIRYARPSAIVVPDLLGAGLLVVFFGIPFLVAAGNGGNLFNPDEPWWILGAIFALLSLGPLAILFVSMRNASFWAEGQENALVVQHWTGRREIPYGEMKILRGIEWHTPSWMRWLGRLLTLFTWRAAAPTLMFGHGKGSGLDLVLKDGAIERFWLSGLLGWERLVGALDHHGVAVAEDVRKLALSAES